MEKQLFSDVTKLDFADPQIDDLLKYSIRTQLESMLKTQLTASERQAVLQKSFIDAIRLVLMDTKVEHQQLMAAFETMYDCAVQSMAQAKLSQELLTKQYVSPTGLIMSPHNCKHTIKDIYRIKGYARGIDQAIRGMLKNKAQITVLYPACGPFAPLLLPLLSYYKEHGVFSSDQIKVSLIDAHPGAVLSLQQLVEDLALEDYVEHIEQVDATEFIPESSVDLLVLEAMQHGFTKEGQLSIAKHLVKYLSIDGWMVPKRISIRGMMVIGETEFNQQWKEVDYSHSEYVNEAALNDRIELGELLRIDKSSLLKMQEVELANGIKVVAGNLITIPKGVVDMGERVLAIYANVETFAAEGVGQYDSGITHPRPDMTFYVDAKPKEVEHTHFVACGGDKVQFYYQLSGLPGFVPVKV
ncbi:hypothetical protein [Pseudoalteromonas galatheae]|uniref:hypothetical protein n=1 Tax=Pseudoalteromonas galatheae TaxID=579562 RepID=UPI0030D3AC67